MKNKADNLNEKTLEVTQHVIGTLEDLTSELPYIKFIFRGQAITVEFAHKMHNSPGENTLQEMGSVVFEILLEQCINYGVFKALGKLYVPISIIDHIGGIAQII